MHDLAILYEHPAWQEPLFAALDARGVDYLKIDLKRAAYASDETAPARVVFNQASPSAYVRGHERAVPHALATMRHLERLGCRVLNGSTAFSMELSKARRSRSAGSSASIIPTRSSSTTSRLRSRRPPRGHA